MLKTYPLIIFDWEGTLFNSHSQSLYADTKHVLEQLHSQRKTLAICSNAPLKSIQKKLQSYEMNHLFSYFSCATASAQKPSACMITDILDSSGFESKDAVLIGDTPTDLSLANNSGIDFISLHDPTIGQQHKKNRRIHQISQLIEV